MKINPNQCDKATELRRKAEAITQGSLPDSPDEIQKILYNLSVHEIELEMQNDELRKIQTELDTARAHYLDLYNLAPVGYLTLNAEGLIVQANQTALTLFGVLLNQLIKQPFSHFIYIEDQDTFYLHDKKLHSTDEPQTCKLRILKNQSTPVWVYLCASVTPDSNGEPLIRLILNDITVLKQAEETILSTQDQLESLTAAVPGIVYQFTLTAKGKCKFLFISKGIEKLFEVTTAEALKDSNLLTHYVLQEDQAAHQEAFERLLLKPGHWQHEHRIKTPGGRIKWVNDLANLKQNTDGSIVWNGIMLDVTDRKNIEEQLKLEYQRKDEFLAMLAHELRNPLAPIRNALQLLKMHLCTDPTLTEQCNVIDRQVIHMSRLLDDLLDIARTLQGKVRLNIDRLLLDDVLKNAIETSRPLIDSRRQELVISRTSQQQWVDGDNVRLSQVLTNLLNNASKYTPEGGKINLSLRQEASCAVIEVRDCGSGIAPEILPHIFDLFTQADNSLDRSMGGLGIGLTLVRQLIEKHGGTVTAESPGIGQGSVFTLKLPLSSTPPSVPEISPIENALPSAKYRILVVDDYVDATDSLSMVLEMNGHDVKVANSGITAIELAQIFKPQVVLLDIGLPDLNGYEVAKRLRAAPETQNSLLIALTGYGGVNELELTKAAGFNHHLLKPLDFEKLSAILEASPAQSIDEPTSFHPLEVNILDALKLKTANNRGLYQKVLNLFCNKHSKDVGLIRSAYQGGDIETAIQLTQRLNDSISSMAITEFTALAITLEQALKQQDDSALEALLTKTGQFLSQITSEYKDILPVSENSSALRQLKSKINVLLENNGFITDDLLRQVKAQVLSDKESEFNSFTQYIFDTDYPKASALLETLINYHSEQMTPAAQDHRPIILVVDDSRVNQELLVSLLEHDYQVKVASNGLRALEIAQIYPHPDLIMLDINMPVMNGYDVCQKLQENLVTRDISIVFVTAASDLRSETRGLQLGALDFITKPIIPAITLLRVRNLVMLKQHEKQLKYLAHYDSLTNIPNRVLLTDRMKQAIAQAKREQSLLAVCYLDIDGFKLINDTLGHQAGDQVLIEITVRIGKILREGDTVARLGGDEFVILLPNLHHIEECITTLKRLHENIALPIIVQDQACRVTASIGVSMFPKDSDDLDMLLRLADQAMYNAKQSGKNRYHLFNPLQD